MDTVEATRESYDRSRPYLDERGKRLWAANEFLAAGPGGLALLARAAGLARSTLVHGRQALRGTAPQPAPQGRRIRRAGGRRTRPVETQPGLIEALEVLVDPLALGDPESPLRWTTKSTHKSAATLRAQGSAISAGEKAAACK
jgi:hypothetical protein